MSYFRSNNSSKSETFYILFSFNSKNNQCKNIYNALQSNLENYAYIIFKKLYIT